MVEVSSFKKVYGFSVDPVMLLGFTVKNINIIIILKSTAYIFT